MPAKPHRLHSMAEDVHRVVGFYTLWAFLYIRGAVPMYRALRNDRRTKDLLDGSSPQWGFDT
jgi:hypothetical protein